MYNVKSKFLFLMENYYYFIIRGIFLFPLGVPPLEPHTFYFGSAKGFGGDRKASDIIEINTPNNKIIIFFH